MQIIECEQNSPEWIEARRGIPTSSNFDKIITIDGSPSKQAEKYMYRLVGERLTGIVEETYQNGNMERGKQLESEAIDTYEFIKQTKTKKVGFCLNGKVGCSPDSLVGKQGLLEVKCPIISTQILYLLKPEKLKNDYWQQTQGQLFVMGKKWVDLFSYYPGLKLLIIRIERDEKYISALASGLERFCSDLDSITDKLK